MGTRTVLEDEEEGEEKEEEEAEEAEEEEEEEEGGEEVLLFEHIILYVYPPRTYPFYTPCGINNRPRQGSCYACIFDVGCLCG